MAVVPSTRGWLLTMYGCAYVAALTPKLGHAQGPCERDAPTAVGIDAAYDRDSDGEPDLLAACSSREPDCYLSAEPLKDRFGSDGGPWSQNDCVPAMAVVVDDRALGLGRGLVIVGAQRATADAVRRALSSRRDATWQTAFDDAPLLADAGLIPRHATCLLSLDFARPPEQAVFVSSPAIASFYAYYCPSGACSAPLNRSEPGPRDGLGLARSTGIEALQVRRPTFAPEGSPLQRFAFSRGVLYARDLSTLADGCTAAEAVAVELEDIAAFDPTGGPPRFAREVACPQDRLHALESELPAGVTLLPPALDRALYADARTHAQGEAQCVLEGVPFGLVEDVRGGARTSTTSQGYLLGTRGLVMPAAQAPTGPAFLVVPEPIAFLDQHLIFSPRPGRPDSLVVSSLRALSEPAFSRELDANDGDDGARPGGLPLRRVVQRFAIETEPPAERVVEALESVSAERIVWPPRASTVDVSVRYGTRWTSNDGPADCWATTAFAEPDDRWQRFAYPLASGASNQLALDFCPNELNGWLLRTQSLRENAEPLCETSLSAMSADALPRQVLQALSCCAPGAGVRDAGSDAQCLPGRLDAGAGASTDASADDGLADAGGPGAACLRSGCDPLRPGSCPANAACAEFFDWLQKLPEQDKACVADHLLAHTEQVLPAGAHWPDVLDRGALRMITMVGLLRTTSLDDDPERERPDAAQHVEPESEQLPTTISQMTNGDAFIGGAHQTLDWNWIVEPDAVGAIDPAYRGMAVRNGRFIEVEHELEFGVARGMWDAHVPLPAGHAYSTHGLRFLDFLRSLERVEHAEGFGEIWRSDWCAAFGLDRRGPSIPAARCLGGADPEVPVSRQPCMSCAPELARTPPQNDEPRPGCELERRFFRTHLGRGLFSPIAAETVSSDPEVETSWMAKRSSWPGCPQGAAPALDADEIVPLGLEDWHACPHRISYLGRPIIDCGHGDTACEEGLRLELHPTHVMTLELATRTYADDACQEVEQLDPCTPAQPVPGQTSGVLFGVFGWANVLSDGHFEFDLWPPPRPTPDSRLCALGHDRDQTEQARPGELPIVSDLGFVVVQPPEGEGPPCGTAPNAGQPRLSCRLLPTTDPNHLHCVYDDPGAGHGGGEDCDADTKCVYSDAGDDGERAVECAHEPLTEGEWTYGNPRMTPRFATSIFEARVFLGWRGDGEACPSDPQDEPCPD